MAGSNIREMGFTKDFVEINFCKRNLYKDLAGMNFAFVLRNIFFTTLVYDVENDLSKNEYLIDDRISCGPKKI